MSLVKCNSRKNHFRCGARDSFVHIRLAAANEFWLTCAQKRSTLGDRSSFRCYQHRPGRRFRCTNGRENRLMCRFSRREQVSLGAAGYLRRIRDSQGIRRMPLFLSVLEGPPRTVLSLGGHRRASHIPAIIVLTFGDTNGADLPARVAASSGEFAGSSRAAVA